MIPEPCISYEVRSMPAIADIERVCEWREVGREWKTIYVAAGTSVDVVAEGLSRVCGGHVAIRLKNAEAEKKA